MARSLAYRYAEARITQMETEEKLRLAEPPAAFAEPDEVAKRAEQVLKRKRSLMERMCTMFKITESREAMALLDLISQTVKEGCDGL
jgi:hypothetical protein